jgi:hypothetical protein
MIIGDIKRLLGHSLPPGTDLFLIRGCVHGQHGPGRHRFHATDELGGADGLGINPESQDAAESGKASLAFVGQDDLGRRNATHP